MIVWLSIAFAGAFDKVDSAGSPAEKADALMTIIGDEAQESVRPEAYARLAELLSANGYHGTALVAWGKAFEDVGELDHLPAAVAVADKIGDHAVIAEPASKHEDFQPKGDDANRATYIIARQHLRQDRLGPALKWAEMVDKESPAFADAETIRGIVLAAQGRHKAALAPLQTARALGKSQSRGQRYDDKMLMNLARTYYGEGNMGQAIYHYATVPRGSEYWPQASFERSWAHFRGGDLPGALGQLKTHTSPFFADAWFPEAYLLEAQGLFLMCKFGSAVDTMNAFQERYEPMLELLDGKLGGVDAEKAWTQVDTYLSGGTPNLPASLLRRYRGEDRMEDARQAVAAYEEEAPRVKSFSSNGKAFAEWSEGRADALRELEGKRVLTWLVGERDALEKQLTALELTRVDILELEARLYERASNTGELEHGDRIGKLRDLRKNKKGFHVWPFQGEYWADELGWFTVDARSDCPESMARKIEKK